MYGEKRPRFLLVVREADGFSGGRSHIDLLVYHDNREYKVGQKVSIERPHLTVLMVCDEELNEYIIKLRAVDTLMGDKDFIPGLSLLPHFANALFEVLKNNPKLLHALDDKPPSKRARR